MEADLSRPRKRSVALDDGRNRRSHRYCKNHGGEKASREAELRENLIEELADVLMYFNDVLLCYGISAEELKDTYTTKFHKNMTRW